MLQTGRRAIPGAIESHVPQLEQRHPLASAGPRSVRLRRAQNSRHQPIDTRTALDEEPIPAPVIPLPREDAA